MKTLTAQEEVTLLWQICPDYHSIKINNPPFANKPTLPTKFKPLRNLVATLLMLDAGLRVGEVVKLNSRDVYFRHNPMRNIIVPANISKSKIERRVPSTSRLNKLLEIYYYLITQPETDVNCCLIPRNSSDCNPITTRAIQRFITIASEESLGFPIHPHTLRHTYATKMMKVTNLRTVQELLGHKNVTSTQIYTHVNDDDKYRAAIALDKKLHAEQSAFFVGKRPGNLHNDLTTPGTNGQIA